VKVMVIAGTRPEVIKLAPVIDELRRRRIECVVCSSGQHREMLEQALTVFDLRPDVSLETMRPGQSLNSLSARLLAGLDTTLAEHSPDWVLVQGDTTTAFCGALASFHRGIPVGHVEAGLRTGDLSSPFPEEANRSLIGRIASMHFPPTRSAAEALADEGISGSNVLVTGNTVVDAIALARAAMARDASATAMPEIEARAGERPIVLVTCHRRENFGGTLESICHMLKRLCGRYPQYLWVFPVHLNPNVQAPVRRILAGIDNLLLTDPVDYLTSLALMSRAVLIVSDSGGIQEEAPSFGVPVVVMRSHTERREGVDAGFATLAGQGAVNIEAAVDAWLCDGSRRAGLRARPNPYGDGLASSRIVAMLAGETVGAFHGE